MSVLPDIASDERVIRLVQSALEEDLGTGDATSLSVVSSEDPVRVNIVARENCIVSGGAVAELAFHRMDDRISVTQVIADGGAAGVGDTIMTLEGSPGPILSGERTALNFMQRMCGIATLTEKYVSIASRHGVAVLDTRKTTPTLRVLEKYAVLCGGGANHRFGLYDKVMLKDNHLAFLEGGEEGRLALAVQRVREQYPALEIEIEIDSPAQLNLVLEQRPDWILLDNMNPDELRECVRICAGRAKLEASGGITLDTLAGIAETGIDAVSVGALTHSAGAIDLGMDFV